MYLLNVLSEFSAAHQLKGYEGACKNLHGHNWRVRAAIECQTTDHIGMTIDYGIIKTYLRTIMNELDHTYLNELPAFTEQNPTSENIARYVYHTLQQLIEVPNCRVKEIEVWESDKSSMTYYE